ncbi:zinc metalloprotease HtpX [Candidatus Microgenomates bacterium]|nr:zinc metalloprotease HtpX [Candidatus Microgenomates bacterium]
MYTQIAANKRKTILLILVFVVLLGLLGWVLAQIQNNFGLFVGVSIFAVVYAWFGYYHSDKVALALSRAKPVTKKQAPQLYRAVENLAITSGLPMPRVYVIDDAAPNAFATGRDPQHAAVAVTTGLLSMMEDEELEGVLAHELSHVGNYDIRVMAIVLVLVTIIVYVSDIFLRMTFWGGNDDSDRGSSTAVLMLAGILLAILAPLIATLLQLAVSRKREYLADASGALLTRYPDGLASALAKIANYPKPMRHASTATAHLFIANPLKGQRRGSWLAQLFSTHPPVAERIKRLEQMGRKQ